MPLTQEQIDRLLSLPRRTGGRRASGPDTSVRDYATWFKLAQKMVDDYTGELVKCHNENCADPRRDTQKTVLCVAISGRYMCRHCFLSGWLLGAEGQTTLEQAS
jgi:hypothetical protein